jgi:hypothetical protein
MGTAFATVGVVCIVDIEPAHTSVGQKGARLLAVAEEKN